MPESEGRDGHGAPGGRTTPSVRARDVSGSLTRQSFLVAATTLVVDCSGYLHSGASHLTGWYWAVLAATVVVDAGLATAPRLSGVVAIAQAIVAVGGAVLLPGPNPVPPLDSAGLLVSGYRAGAWLDRGPAVVSLVCLGAGSVGGEVIGGQLGQRRILLYALANAVLPWLVGRYTTARRAYIAELEQRAEREQRERRQALAAAITEERSSIARDLHDVISHHVSAIGVHAGVARLRATASPAGVTGLDLADSLTAVETSSRAAMVDLRQLLDFLHGDPAGEVNQSGLDNLAELLDTVRGVGLRARVNVHGAPPPLPKSLDIAAYRVVQEMLTNALRHGDAGVAEVELRYEAVGLTVTTTNPLPTKPRPRPDSPHRGLQGIRSRAALFDGSVVYGPTPDGTAWTTTVTFPLDRS